MPSFRRRDRRIEGQQRVGCRYSQSAAKWPFDLAILLLFFVPNLLVAEIFIRHLHRKAVLPSRLRWPFVTALAGAGCAFAYAIAMLSATPTGKFGKHLLPLLGG